MSRLRFVIVFVLCYNFAKAQDVPGYSPYLNIAYQGNFLVRPGLSVSYDMPIRDLNITPEKAESLLLQPHVGIFSYIDRNYNVLAGLDLGIVRTKVKKKGASALSIGLNYLGESEKLGFTVDLGSGDRNNIQREWRHYFLPTFNYEWSTKMGKKHRFFTKAKWGYALNFKRESEMYLLIALGIKLPTTKR